MGQDWTLGLPISPDAQAISPGSMVTVGQLCKKSSNSSNLSVPDFMCPVFCPSKIPRSVLSP
jgi:hypothetical protein